ncbi:MAG: hypothetical protein ABSG59_22655 [Verrucomicrobiota bacterium]
MNDNAPFFAPRKLRRDACLNTLSGNDFTKASAILTNPGQTDRLRPQPAGQLHLAAQFPRTLHFWQSLLQSSFA